MTKLIENKSASEGFEKGFLNQSLAKLINECDKYELAPLFEKTFREHQPVLEAGCGTGKWCGWFVKKGIQSDGIDWSKALVEKAQREIPGANFFAGDIRNIPKPDSYYGGIISLGAVEHSTEGPLPALREFSRVLRQGGIAIVTVPHGGKLRRVMMFVEKITPKIKPRALVKKILGRGDPKPEHIGTTLKEAKVGTNKSWVPKFAKPESGFEFFEYEFNRKQMHEFIRQTDFEIVQEFAAFGNEGILHNFGNIAGRWNDNRSDVDFTILGKFLRKIIPVSAMGHMLCYVLKKKS